MTHLSKKRIFVGVSGGVDSSVTAALLQEQGHEVIGVFIRTWQPDWLPCSWRQERRDAMRVCAHLDIPFVELDLEQEYKKGVADYMVSEYRKGRTPNPDVMCNREVKFGGFLKWALEHGGDFVATGHYVRRTEKDGVITMLKGLDASKDQSYFLWTLSQEQLTHILFPLGNLQKSEVRKEAERFNLPTAQKKDSQGICFIGDIDMKDFLKHYIDEQEGDVLDIKGHTIGKHKGALFFTLGERHGFHIDSEHKGSNDKPYYVIAKDIEANTIVVSENPQSYLEQNFQQVSLVELVDNQAVIKKGQSYDVQIRYHGDLKKVSISDYDSKSATATLVFDDSDPTITKGQSVVIYQGDLCLGGGIVA